MMITTPNPVLVRFAEALVPDRWTSRQAQALYAAAMEGEADGSWAAEAVQGTVRVEVLPPADSAMSPAGTPHDAARRRAETGIAALRAEADRLDAVLRAYGPAAFVARPEPMRAPTHPFDVEPWLLGILRRPWLAITLNGRRFVRDASGAAVRA